MTDICSVGWTPCKASTPLIKDHSVSHSRHWWFQQSDQSRPKEPTSSGYHRDSIRIGISWFRHFAVLWTLRRILRRCAVPARYHQTISSWWIYYYDKSRTSGSKGIQLLSNVGRTFGSKVSGQAEGFISWCCLLPRCRIRDRGRGIGRYWSFASTAGAGINQVRGYLCLPSRLSCQSSTSGATTIWPADWYSSDLGTIDVVKLQLAISERRPAGLQKRGCIMCL